TGSFWSLPHQSSVARVFRRVRKRMVDRPIEPRWADLREESAMPKRCTPPPLATAAGAGLDDMERQIAGCRILLSVVALFAVAVDPTTPALFSQLTGRPLGIDAALATLAVHLVVSLGIYLGLVSRIVAPQAVATTTTWTDVFFATAIAAFTGGVSSPFFLFFVFAITTSGFRWGLRMSTAITALTVVLRGGRAPARGGPRA